MTCNYHNCLFCSAPCPRLPAYAHPSQQKSILTLIMGTLLFVIPAAVLVAILSGSRALSSCHELIPTEQGLPHLSTKRPYYSPNPDDLEIPGTGSCEPVRIWYFGRHGTRYPDDDDIIEMQSQLPRLFEEISNVENSSAICSPSMKYFLSWRPNPSVNLTMESHLQARGYQELASIGSRFASRFPGIFPNRFSNESYVFRATDKQRTNASAWAFAESIFGNKSSTGIFIPPGIKDDPVLKFYSRCKRWEEEVENNPNSEIELKKFQKSSSVMKAVRERVSKRLGLNRVLNVEELTLMYTTCAFESAWNGEKLSQWCVPFEVEDLKVMEYAEDLEYYWKDGYGFQVNWEQACVAIQDGVRFLDDYLDNGVKRVSAYFSHSGSTLKMIARLGLFNDSFQLRADNFEEVKESHQWRTSKIDSFATNIAFVLFRCGQSSSLRGNSQEAGNDNLQVALLVQEKLVALKGCGAEKAMCSYREFREQLGKYVDHCDFDEICRVDEGGNIS